MRQGLIIKILLSLIISLTSYKTYSQTVYHFDSINLDQEQAAVYQFFEEFAACNDANEIQEYVFLPCFTARDHKYPMGLLYISGNDSLSDKQIDEIWHNARTKNPLKYYALKYQCSAEYRKKLATKGVTYTEDFFATNKNRNEYFNWLIQDYKFPLEINIEKLKEFEPVHLSRGYRLEQKTYQISIIDIMCYGIIKVNGEYKIVYASFIWN